jgi:endoglucanase
MRFRFAALALGALFPFFSAAPVAAQSFVAEHGALKVQGNKIIDSKGQPITLRGMALYWSQWKPAFYNAQCVKWLRDDWKCTVVRASMAVTDGGYLTNPAAEMAKVRTVVQAAIDLGIYVIVDFHETKNGNQHLNEAKKFFDDLTKEFGKYPNLIYETWNEPDNTMAWATDIKPYHEAVIPAIRANSEGIILCGTRSWCQEVDEAAANPITISTNLAYTLHFYATDHRDANRAKAKTALGKGIALMVTEGGLSEASGDGRIDTAEARKWCEFMDQNGILWTNWSLADLKESSGALKEGAAATGGWNESQLNPSGVWTRNRLRQMAATVSLARPLRNHSGYPASATALEARRDANGRLLLAPGKGVDPRLRAAAGVYFAPLVP